MNFIRLLPFILFVLLAGIFGFVLMDKQAMTQSPLLDKAIPEFSLPVYKQTDHFQSASMQKPAIIVFWASWCGICKINLPVVSKFAADHKIAFYGVAYRDNENLLNQVMPSLAKNVTFTQLALDEQGSVSSRFGLVGVPTLFAVDENGIVRYVKSGAVSTKDLEKHVLPLVE
jgi:cytochrome c biogenesis protein CcmG/thiol:disulfide interchange protein DsbE